MVQFRVQIRNDNFADLFTDRQLVALTTFSDLVAEARERVQRDAVAAVCRTMGPLRDGGIGADAYAEAVGCIWHSQWIVWPTRSATIALWSQQLEARLVTAFSRQATTYDLGLPRE